MITMAKQETLDHFQLERHEQFITCFRDLPNKLHALLAMNAVRADSLPDDMPNEGVYLFSEGENYLYVGRSNNMPQRIRNHVSKSHLKAAFAFKLAREETGNLKASYKPEGSRANLMEDPTFKKAFHDAGKKIACMELRYVEESEEVPQCLLEVYVAEVLGAKYNDFKNH